MDSRIGHLGQVNEVLVRAFKKELPHHLKQKFMKENHNLYKLDLERALSKIVGKARKDKIGYNRDRQYNWFKDEDLKVIFKDPSEYSNRKLKSHKKYNATANQMEFERGVLLFIINTWRLAPCMGCSFSLSLSQKVACTWSPEHLQTHAGTPFF